MASKIISIVNKKPNEDIIKFLNKLLEEANSGDIQDLCGVYGLNKNYIQSFSFGVSQMECLGLFQQGTSDMLNHWNTPGTHPDDVA